MKHSLGYIFLFSYLLIYTNSSVKAQTADTSMSAIYSMSIEELINAVITTAGKKTEKISEIPASVVLLTREDIKAAGYADLAEILTNIPGMFVINDYYYNNGTFGVRGFWPGSDDRNIMVLVNGVSQVYDITSTYIVNNITVPVEAIDRIEVVRGPMSVIYGSGAFYGVINIITNETSKSEVSVSGGSQKTGKFFGRSAGSQGDLNYIVNASFYNSRGIDQPIIKMVNDTSLLPSYGITKQYTTGGRLENNQKYMGISFTYKPLTFDISFNESVGETYYLIPSPLNGSSTRFTSVNSFIDYKKSISKFLTIEGKFIYSTSRMWEKYDYLDSTFYGVQQHETNTWEGELDAFIKISKHFDITSGLHCRSVLNAYNMYDLPSFGLSTSHQYLFLAPDDNITVRSTYAQVNFQPIENLKFVAGIRFEQMPGYTIGKYVPDSNQYYHYKEDKVSPIPRFAVIWSPNDRNIFKILYGQAINRPSFFQNISNNFDRNLPVLQPEWITTYELNYISFLSEKFILNAGLYYNSLNRLISRTSEIDSLHNYKTWFGNAGKMVTIGGEITIQAKPVNNLHLEISATYQNTKDLRKGFENIQVAYSPKILGYMKAIYYISSGLTISITGNYVGKMLAFYDETVKNKDNSYGARIGDNVKPYLLLGANVRMENIFNHGYYANIKFDNILNQEIRYPTTTNNSWATRGTLGAGTTFLISLGKKF
jgi:outer membrane cobalamin receptor